MNMKPDFKKIVLNKATQSRELLQNKRNNNWQTSELINVKPIYTEKDIEKFKHLNYAAGIPPFLRGPYPAMYVLKPWTIRDRKSTRLNSSH